METINGSPYAERSQTRFDEGEVASAVTPRRGSLLYKMRAIAVVMVVCMPAAFSFAEAAKFPCAFLPIENAI